MRRAGAALALLGCGVLLLATTQPWVRTVTEVAAGAPRSRGSVDGAELTTWLAPVALVAALAVVAGLAGMRWARPVAGAATVGVLAGAVSAVVEAGSRDTAGATVVSADPTGWLWVGAVAALGTALGTALWCRPQARTEARATTAPDAVPPEVADAAAQGPQDAEAERRRAAEDWRDLSEGRDPTDP